MAICMESLTFHHLLLYTATCHMAAMHHQALYGKIFKTNKTYLFESKLILFDDVFNNDILLAELKGLCVDGSVLEDDRPSTINKDSDESDSSTTVDENEDFSINVDDNE
eukprot:14794761-Ditylum_brightwellii.AAC.1